MKYLSKLGMYEAEPSDIKDSSVKYGWHLRMDERLGFSDDRIPKPGKRLYFRSRKDDPIPTSCLPGMHACPTLIEAFRWGKGVRLCRVKVFGIGKYWNWGSTKFVGVARTVVSEVVLPKEESKKIAKRWARRIRSERAFYRDWRPNYSEAESWGLRQVSEALVYHKVGDFEAEMKEFFEKLGGKLK